MKMRAIPLFLSSLILAVITVVLGIFSLAILIDLVRLLFLGGYTIGGKEIIYVPLFPVLTWLFTKWTREAWRAWRNRN